MTTNDGSMQNIKPFMSIRKTAESGLISEHYLRRMLKRGELPHIMSGRKVLVNYNLLVEKLNEKSKEGIKNE